LARQRLEEPDVGDGHGELDVAHPLTADLGERDLHAALVADVAAEPDALELPAVALPVLDGAENALAEEAVALRLEGAIVDRLRLRDLAVGPAPDLLGRGDLELDEVEVTRPGFAGSREIDHMYLRPPKARVVIRSCRRRRVRARAGRGRRPFALAAALTLPVRGSPRARATGVP